MRLQSLVDKRLDNLMSLRELTNLLHYSMQYDGKADFDFCIFSR